MIRRITLIFLLSAAPLAWGVDIEGVQPAALDQPRVNICLRRAPNGPPLSARTQGEETINIQAFLDTGASGVLISRTTANGLGIKNETVNGRNVIFHDVGVGGGDQFDVSEPLYVSIAPNGKNGAPEDASGYPILIGPIRAQLGKSAGLMDMLTGGLDVVGMPAIRGRVIVMDPKPVDSFADTMRCGLFDPKTQGAIIPKTDRHVKVSYGSFERFTSVNPAGAPGPALADNPFIGPSPTGAPANVPPVLVTFDGKQASGAWLLDTGAAASMISHALAAKLGVTYAPGTEDTASPKLIGPPEKDQFAVTVGGIGGQKKSAGFFLDTLVLPTRENDPIVYKRAPVLVSDITVEDPKTHQKITLDGVLGMNYFVASAFVSEAGLLPDIGKMSQGPYDWVIFDQPRAELDLKLKPDLVSNGGGTIEIKPSHPAQNRGR